MAERRATPNSMHIQSTPLNLPITSPHISGRFVSLSLSNHDRILVLTEVQFVGGGLSSGAYGRIKVE